MDSGPLAGKPRQIRSVAVSPLLLPSCQFLKLALASSLSANRLPFSLEGIIPEIDRFTAHGGTPPSCTDPPVRKEERSPARREDSEQGYGPENV